MVGENSGILIVLYNGLRKVLELYAHFAKEV